MASLPVIGETSRVQLRTLVFIRWVAIAGQVAALLVVHYGLGVWFADCPHAGGSSCLRCR